MKKLFNVVLILLFTAVTLSATEKGTETPSTSEIYREVTPPMAMIEIYGPRNVVVGASSHYYFSPNLNIRDLIWVNAQYSVSTSQTSNYSINVVANAAGLFWVDAQTGIPAYRADAITVTVRPRSPWITSAGANIYLSGDPLAVAGHLDCDNTESGNYDDFEWELTGPSDWSLIYEAIDGISVRFTSAGQNFIKMRWKQNGQWSDWSNTRTWWVSNPQ